MIIAEVYNNKNVKRKLEMIKCTIHLEILLHNLMLTYDVKTIQIKTMFADYKSFNNLSIDLNVLSKRIYYYTHGYPF